MKISILLPFKENFSPSYAGAVSLFINDTLKISKYSDELFETQEMYDLLLSFYKYGFVIIQDVPTEDNFLVKFANKVGSVRRTNFGEHFNV